MTDTEPKSKFNYSLDWLRTIRDLENQCNTFALQEDYQNWLKTIKCLRRELDRRMNDEQRNNCDEAIETAEQVVKGMNTGATVDGMTAENVVSNAEMEIRKITRDLDMDMETTDDPGDSVL